MTLNLGMKKPGGLTASNPGPTIYVPFASYNDSGDSEAMSGLAVSDIEIFKNGNATPRATDSGYSLISDTGQYGDRVGLHRFSIQLFNTSDDTGFYDTGSQYHVAVDSVTIDGKTVRHFPAVFEIGTPAVNLVELLGDTGALANLRDMFNGTGYTDDVSAPASRSQVSAIGAASGGSLNFGSDTGNVGQAIKSQSFVGVETSGDYANTNLEDANYHQIDDTANNIEIVYDFNVGGGRTAVEVTWRGGVVGLNDTLQVYAYNFTGSSWDQIGEITGGASAPSAISDNVVNTYPLLGRHTGTGTDLGKVYIRFSANAQSNPTLYTDQLIVAAVNIGQSIGYANGAIWIDTGDGVAGTEAFVNGVADNPVNSLADAVTLSGTLGIKRFNVAAGSNLTLAAAADRYEFLGENWTLAFNGQSISNADIRGANISGTFTAASNPIFDNCIVSTLTGPGAVMRFCYFENVTFTNNGTNGWYLNDCRSRVAGTSAPTFDFGAAVGASSLNMRAYMGGIRVANMAKSGSDLMSYDGIGTVTFLDSCDTGGVAVVRGTVGVVDQNDNGKLDIRVTSPVTNVTRNRKVVSSTDNSITLDTGASAVDGYYDPGTITIVSGTGQGQTRGILDYNGTTKVATLDKDWRVNPDATSSYIVRATEPQLHVNEGKLQAGGDTTTVTLNTAASANDNVYVGQTIFFVGGKGQDQARVVTAYNGTTKVATLHKTLDTGTDTGTSYIMLPLPTIGDQIINNDTGIAAIKAQTDKLTFDTGANELHADIRKVNNIQVDGTGASGDEWGPV